MSLLDLAPDLLAIPSTPAAGTAATVDFLRARVLSRLPVSVEVMTAPGGAGREVNLLATLDGRAGGGGLLLATHLDTVPPGEAAAWTDTGGAPFAPRTAGDRLVGLGAADAKLDFLCKAEALARLAGAPLRRPVHLLATYGEETGMRGMREFLQSLPLDPAPVAALVGEPTDLKLAVRHKGRLELRLALATREPLPAPRRERLVRLVMRGRAAHASSPGRGRNAIEAALASLPEAAIVALRGGVAANTIPPLCELVAVAGSVRRPPGGWELAGDGERTDEVAPMPASLVAALGALLAALARAAGGFPEEDHSFRPPRLTHALCRLEARGPRAEVAVDVRVLPGQESARVVAAFSRCCAALGCGPVSVTCTAASWSPPLDLDAGAPLAAEALAALAACGLPPETVTKPGCTEAGLLAGAGIPAVVFGAGPAGAIHRPNEWTSLAALRRAAEFYGRFIAEWCGR